MEVRYQLLLLSVTKIFFCIRGSVDVIDQQLNSSIRKNGSHLFPRRVSYMWKTSSYASLPTDTLSRRVIFSQLSIAFVKKWEFDFLILHLGGSKAVKNLIS